MLVKLFYFLLIMIPVLSVVGFTIRQVDGASRKIYKGLMRNDGLVLQSKVIRETKIETRKFMETVQDKQRFAEDQLEKQKTSLQGQRERKDSGDLLGYKHTQDKIRLQKLAARDLIEKQRHRVETMRQRNRDLMELRRIHN